MAATNVPPWHMWGSEQTFQVATTADVRQPVITRQLSAVKYKRPETWEFLVWAFLVDPLATPGGAPFLWNLQVQFSLTIGLGRTQTTLKCPVFLFDPDVHTIVPSSGDEFLKRWTTSFSVQPISDAPSPVGSQPNTFDHFVAQDIQAQATAYFAGVPSIGTVINLNVGSFFAPRSHIRPEWHLHHFDGGELGGR